METSPVTIEKTIAEQNSSVVKDVCDALNKVIAKTINSRNAFLDCASGAESTALSKTCLDWKHRRDAFALELQKIVTRLGHSPVTDENFVGWVHRQWTKARISVESDTDHAIAGELAVEEESMRLAMDEALEHDNMPTEARILLENEKKEAELFAKMFQSLDEKLEPEEYVNLNRDN